VGFAVRRDLGAKHSKKVSGETPSITGETTSTAGETPSNRR
jgi:hypothetical protein